MDIKNLEQIALNIRKSIINMIYNASSGHPGGALSATEIITTLYFSEMNISNPKDEFRDRLVLSKGHASAVLYGALAEKGFIKKEELSTFRNINSSLQGHPDMNKTLGVDMTTGSLGQGLSVANGMALAGKLDKKDYRVYCILGDGELQEGQVWEAAMSAGHYKLDNLCVFVDNNNFQIDGSIDKIMNPYPIDKKFESFGFNVICIDGHNFKEIQEALLKARETKEKPTVILAKTIKGKGISYMENTSDWHGKAPNENEFNLAMKELEKF